jgi:hypothetical protein
MRGDQIFVKTLQGSKSRDEGSACSQPLPFNSVRDFQLRQTDGRNRASLTQEPDRMNNYTALVSIADVQNGGDSYTFDVSWRADNDTKAAPAPFFDDVRACQDMVRQRFLAQNGRGSYIDFDNFADRQGVNGPGGNRADRGRGNTRKQETIQGHGSARSRSEARDLTYSCVVDTQQGQVISGDYRLSGDGIRTNDRVRLR